MEFSVLIFLVIGIIGSSIIDCHPTVKRIKRQSSSYASSSASASSSSDGDNSNSFGIGAAAGVGGLGASSGLGSFSADTKSNAFLPWGAFAAINLPQGGRIGAGCQGFSCGFQFGQYVAQFPSFGSDDYYNNGGYNGPNSGFQDQQGLFSRNSGFGSNYNNNNYNFPQFRNLDFPMFTPFQFPQFQPLSSSFNTSPIFGPSSSSSSSSINDFARLGNGHGGGSNGATYSSSSHNGIFSESGTRVDSDGRVTSYQAGTGSQPSIQTRILSPGQSKNIYSGSAVVAKPDGSVSSYRSSGLYQ